MEGEKKDELPTESLDGQETEKEETNTTLDETPDNLSVDTSEEEAEKLGSKQNDERIEEGSEQVTSFFKLDKKGEKQIKNLLQKELKIEVQDIKKDFLIIFGLFASFVTFISINVQAFRNSVNLVEIVGVISISLSFIIFFALIINTVVKKELEWADLKKPIYIINLTFLIIGVAFIAYGESKNKNIIEELDQRIVTDGLNIIKLNSTIDSLKNQFTNSKSTLNTLEVSINELNLISKKQENKKTKIRQQPTTAITNKGVNNKNGGSINKGN